MKRVWWRILARHHHHRSRRLMRAAVQSPSVRTAKRLMDQAVEAAARSEKYFNMIKGARP